jgi:hypothetical protein
MKNFLIYRALSHHATFFWILLLPILSEKGMIDWASWLITTLFTIGSMFASKYAYKWWEKYWYNYSRIRSTIWQAACLIIAWIFFKSRIFLTIIYFIFSIFDWIISPSWNHQLIQITKWKSIATTRSIIFWCVALYITFMKRILSYLEPNHALIILWIIIILTNILLAKKLKNLKNK